MKPHKVIDVIIQSFIILFALISTAINPQEWFMPVAMSYLFIGPYQVLGLLVSLGQGKVSPKRTLYGYSLLVYFLLALTDSVLSTSQSPHIQDVGYGLFSGLIVLAGIMAIFYCYICYTETFTKTIKL